jgi:Ca2+-binding RTX toxin-like protein
VTPGDIVQGPAGTVLNGTAGAEVLSATGAVHELHGGAGEDLLVGSIGSDLLDGGAGGDVMIGGLGNDIYIVDEKWIDHVVELDGEGVDEVRSYVQYELPDGVENLTFLGAGGIRVEGNRLDNVMTGNAESNILAGGDGNDVLIGGGAGDFLEGGLGADRFVYLTSADSTAAAYDVLYGFQSGSDKIDLTALSVASISWTKQTENTGVSLWNYFMVTVATADAPLTIRVTADVLSMSDFLVHSVIVGTPGNDTLQGTFFADSIDGMGGNDTIYGAQGDDTIDGMGGDDTIYGAEGDDTIAGGGGQNALYGESGNDRLTASGSAGDRLFGGLGNDVLEGGAGNDRLQGDAGSDRLTGGSGADIFAFLNTADSAGYSMRSDGKKLLPDVITDFVSGVDKISLEAIDAVDGGDPSDAFSWLGTGAFTHHAGEVRYDIADGRANVYADTNGDGLADMQIVVMTTSLAATDFIF